MISCKYYTGLLIVLGFLLARESIPRTPHQPTPDVEHTIWDGNNISTIHGNHGDMASYHLTGNSGLEWPKGEETRAVFQTGLWVLAGRINGIEEIRSAAAEYTCEYSPGLPSSTDTTEHIYRIHKEEIDAFLNNDWNTFSNMTLMLPEVFINGWDAFTELVDTELPTDDFMNWPVEKGAPWVDVNNDSIYDPQDGDHPEIVGDMFHWYVMNDHDPNSHTPLWRTDPLGVTVRVSMFGFNDYPVLENTVFIKWEIENSGTNQLDSLFIGWWSDPDLGSHLDDQSGVDTLRNIMYCYNYYEEDYRYGLNPPAVGHVLFQPPIISSVGDTAYHSGVEIIDHKHIQVFSHIVIISADNDLDDPENAQEVFDYFNGLTLSGNEIIDPSTGNTTKYIYAGNPVTGEGWVDDWRGDKRQIMSFGPLSMAPGEKQEIVGGMVMSRGSSRLLSVAQLWGETDWLQYIWDNQFSIMEPVADVVQISNPHNTESIGPFQMLFQIDANEGWTLSNDPVNLYYSIDSVFHSIPLTIINQPYPNTYAAWIPEQTAVIGTMEMKYFLEMSADNGFEMTWPMGAPYNYKLFTFGPDTTSPVIGDLTELSDIHYMIPMLQRVFASAEDDRFPVTANLNWQVNQDDVQIESMTRDTMPDWNGIIGWIGSMSVETANLGDTIYYWVTAEAESQNNNISMSDKKWFLADDKMVIGPWEDYENYPQDHEWKSRNGWFSNDPFNSNQWSIVLQLNLSSNNPDSIMYGQYVQPLDLRFINEALISTRGRRMTTHDSSYYYFEVSDDQLNWDVLATYSETDTHFYMHYDLKDYLGEDSLFIRFRGEFNRPGYVKWFIDDVVLHSDTSVLHIESDPVLPSQFTLHQNYPNPFNPTTTIRFSVDARNTSRLQIFDITGRLVVTLIDETLNPGEHEVIWNAKNVASGIYFYRLETPTRQITKKMVVLK